MPSYAGSFLVAKPVLQDPSFRQTVVLLLQHGKEGAFGLVVNRPAPVEGLPYALFVGGPCPAEGLLMLHGHAEWAEEASSPSQRQVAPGIFLGDSSCMTRVNDAPEEQALRYRLFNGYAGWGSGQLEGELASGAWALVPARGEVLFDTPTDDLWLRLLPPSIPEPSLN
jgi:putative transcriptional regulator